MTLNKLITQLVELIDKGCGDMEVRLLSCNDNPIENDGIPINGTYAILGHPVKNVDGVYIDGTTC